MKRSSRAWILLPVAIVAIVLATILVSNYQTETGIAEPNKAGCAAVSAAIVARDLLRDGAGGYSAYSDALLVATVARKNAPRINPADTRLDHLLIEALDCLAAAREAWQAEIDQTWNPEIHGVAIYWKAAHPSLDVTEEGALTAVDIREFASARASELLEKAADLVD
jgi:hypothetical protein